MLFSCVTALLHKERRGNIVKSSTNGHLQRRAFFRVNYPHRSRLKISNMDVEIVDICQIGLRFCGTGQWEKLSNIIKNDAMLELSLKFHDNTTQDIKGKIKNCYTDINSHNQHYVLMFDEPISDKQISDEQAYLLKHFPDYSKELLEKSVQN